MKIIIVDDSKTFLEGMKYYLQKDQRIEIIGEASNGSEFMNLENIHQADIILMDIQMPEMNGIKAAKRVLWDMNYLKIIAITMFKEKAYLKELIEAGFKGCVFKNEIYEKLPLVIEKVMNDNICFPEDIRFEHKESSGI